MNQADAERQFARWTECKHVAFALCDKGRRPGAQIQKPTIRGKNAPGWRLVDKLARETVERDYLGYGPRDGIECVAVVWQLKDCDVTL